MQSTRKIGLILALVFLLPALFFSVYEISSLSKDEKMIEEIYNKQLEAILFSVNQYSDDILNSWSTRIETTMEDVVGSDSIPPKINALLSLNPSLVCAFISDTLDHLPVQKIYSSSDSIEDLYKDKIRSALAGGTKLIQELKQYKMSGFQKIVALPHSWSDTEDLQCMIFVIENKNGFRVVGLLLNPGVFIQDLVGPRLQKIAKDQFILSVFDSRHKPPIYSTLSADSVSAKMEGLTKNFWLFPDYAIGIRTKGSSLQVLINERTSNNIIMLLSLDVILIIAVFLVFRNVKKEVQLAQNKADFVSNVSHEIRTPLALISMFAETLEMGRVPTEEKKKEYYGIISKETHRLSSIVNKILNFSQTEANKKTLHPEVLVLGTEIKDVLNTYDFHLTNKGFEYTFKESGDIRVLADKEALIEVLINLLDNAIKYSSDKKRIEIETGSENNEGFVTVKDYGVGISSQDQKLIFNKFYRVSSGDLAKSKGTGLGLSLVKQLMEAQKGRITVSSKSGKGSSFTAYFPLETKS